jgi:hypothetical protein
MKSAWASAMSLLKAFSRRTAAMPLCLILVAVRYFGLSHTRLQFAIIACGMVRCEDEGPFRSSKTKGRLGWRPFFLAR